MNSFRVVVERNGKIRSQFKTRSGSFKDLYKQKIPGFAQMLSQEDVLRVFLLGELLYTCKGGETEKLESQAVHTAGNLIN